MNISSRGFHVPWFFLILLVIESPAQTKISSGTAIARIIIRTDGSRKVDVTHERLTIQQPKRLNRSSHLSSSTALEANPVSQWDGDFQPHSRSIRGTMKVATTGRIVDRLKSFCTVRSSDLKLGDRPEPNDVRETSKSLIQTGLPPAKSSRSPQILSVATDSALPNLTFSYDTSNGDYLDYNADSCIARVRLTIRNTGTASAGPFRIGWYVSETPSVDSSVFLVATRYIDSLAAGAFDIDVSAAKLDTMSSLLPATYYLMFVIDDLLQVAESNESDNAGYFMRTFDFLPPTEGIPNLFLYLGDGSWSGFDFDTLKNELTAGVSVGNDGSAASPPFRVGFYLTATDDSGKTYFYRSSAFHVLAPGYYASIVGTGALDYLMPDLPVGTYFLVASINDDRKVTESNYEDNFGLSNSTFTTGRPNLVFSTGSGSTNTISYNRFTSELDLTATVQNNGPEDVLYQDFHIGWYLSADSVITVNDSLIAGASIISLASGQFITKNASAMLDSARGFPSGRYYIGAIIDDAMQVRELSETDNTFLYPNTVAYQGGLPNLRVYADSGSDNAIRYANATTRWVNITVQNSGTRDAKGFYVGFFLSSDSAISGDDYLLSSTAIPSNQFPAGRISGVSSAQFNVNTISQLPAGEYFVGAYIDYPDLVKESDESDNTFVVGKIQKTATGVNEPAGTVTRFSLEQNYPNPFNPSTTLRYGLPSRSRVRLVVYNVLGQIVAHLIDGEQSAGWHSIAWDANVASGLYFYRLEAVAAAEPGKSFVGVMNMILLK